MSRRLIAILIVLYAKFSFFVDPFLPTGSSGIFTDEATGHFFISAPLFYLYCILGRRCGEGRGEHGEARYSAKYSTRGSVKGDFHSKYSTVMTETTDTHPPTAPTHPHFQGSGTATPRWMKIISCRLVNSSPDRPGSLPFDLPRIYKRKNDFSADSVSRI